MLMQFENSSFGSVRSIYEKEILFVAKDLCECLDIKNTSQALQRIDEEDIKRLRMKTNGGRQQVLFVNESGLYQLIFMSKKPEARAFVKWVTSEVLPSIRQTGSYTLPKGVSEADIPKVEKMVREWSMYVDTKLTQMLTLPKGE